MKTTLVFRLLTVLFAFTLACIIFAADLDVGKRIFGPVYDFPHGDKIAHFFLMGLLSLLVSLSFRPRRFLGLILYSVIILGILITLEEITQIPLSHRDFSLKDLAADYAGILVFGELGVLLRRIIVREGPARVL